MYELLLARDSGIARASLVANQRITSGSMAWNDVLPEASMLVVGELGLQLDDSHRPGNLR